MKTRNLICIVCPNGCELTAEIVQDEPLEVGEVTGSLCDKGPLWAQQEIANPMRTIASNILVEGGDYPLVSVRTDAAVPREMIAEVMLAIKAKSVAAPVQIGEVLISNPAGTTCNIIATRLVKEIRE
jgi:CxxC motif-containing protein